MGSSWVGPVPSGEMGPDLFPAPGAGARPGGARPRLPPRLPHRQDGALPGRDRQGLPSSQGLVGRDPEHRLPGTCQQGLAQWLAGAPRPGLG